MEYLFKICIKFTINTDIKTLVWELCFASRASVNPQQ